MHVSQVSRGLRIGNQGECLQMEVEAHGVEASTWGILWDFKPPQRTRLEQELAYILQLFGAEGEPGLYRHVLDRTGYLTQCDLWVPR
jgi:hypothetical protein